MKSRIFRFLVCFILVGSIFQMTMLQANANEKVENDVSYESTFLQEYFESMDYDSSSLDEARLEEIEEVLREYVKNTKDGVVFDREKAISDNVIEEVIYIGDAVNMVNQVYTSDPSVRISLPIWGNWCGPGYGGGTPKDILDQGCMAHDKCYGARGYFACSCDKALINYITANMSRMRAAEKLAAATIKTYFQLAWCNSKY